VRLPPVRNPALDASAAEISDGAEMSGIEEQSPYPLNEDSQSETSAMSIDEQSTSIDLAGADSNSDSFSEIALHLPSAEGEAMHEWELEAEYETLMFGAVPEIRDWNTHHDQIKQDLKKKAKPLTLAQFNQLTIIHNFATLRLKGLDRLTASREIAAQWLRVKDSILLASLGFGPALSALLQPMAYQRRKRENCCFGQILIFAMNNVL
jgi:hypothetical protein